MTQKMKTIILMLGALVLSVHSYAQSVSAALSGADTVRQGDILQLTFSFENVDANGFELPELVGLKVVGGPSRRTQMSIINGQRSSSATFTYAVVAEQAGVAFVPRISRVAGEEEVQTEPLSVFVTADPNYVPLEEQRLEPVRKSRRPTVRM